MSNQLPAAADTDREGISAWVVGEVVPHPTHTTTNKRIKAFTPPTITSPRLASMVASADALSMIRETVFLPQVFPFLILMSFF
tara:strand:- start:201 stop:449 length:249 start_codon:yes stop_codon:yes gene_type:complete